MGFILQDSGGSGGGGQAIATAVSSATSTTSSAWGTTQDVAFTAVGQSLLLPAIVAGDLSPVAKRLTINNNGSNSFLVQLSGGTITSAIGTFIKPGEIWTFEPKTVVNCTVVGSSPQATAITSEVSGVTFLGTLTPTAFQNTPALSIPITGLSFVAGATATYQISGKVRAFTTAINGFLAHALFDTLTPTVPIAGTVTNVCGSTTTTGNQGTGSYSYPVNLTQGRTYQIKCWGNGGATISSDTNGECSLSWQKLTGVAVSNLVGAQTGDIKHSHWLIDHGSDWILLDGRLKTSLTVSQQAVATSLGYGVNIPDYRGKMPIGSSASFPILTFGGSPTTTINQVNLPNINLSGGNHGHSVNDGGHSHSFGIDSGSINGSANGGERYLRNGGSTVNSPVLLNYSTSAVLTGVSINANTISIPLGGSGTALNTLSPYISGNYFVWLGSSANTVTVNPTLIGATAGAAGIAGYAPTPAAGDQVKFLRGDSTWQTVGGNPMVGASAGSAGVAGIVPSSLAGDQNKYLRADATWQTVPSGGPITVNGSTNLVNALYSVALAHFNTTFEFYQDSYFRFNWSGTLQIAAVATAKAIGVYGYNSSGTSSSTFPLVAAGGLAPKGAYGSIAVGSFTTISDTSISADYDDIQTYWIQCANNPVKYRITIMGGFTVGVCVERWDFSVISTNTKITIP